MTRNCCNKLKRPIKLPIQQLINHPCKRRCQNPNPIPNPIVPPDLPPTFIPTDTVFATLLPPSICIDLTYESGSEITLTTKVANEESPIILKRDPSFHGTIQFVDGGNYVVIIDFISLNGLTDFPYTSIYLFANGKLFYQNPALSVTGGEVNIVAGTRRDPVFFPAGSLLTIITHTGFILKPNINCEFLFVTLRPV